MRYSYTWRESLDSQLGRVKQRFAAEVEQGYTRRGANLKAQDWMWINQEIEQFVIDYEGLQRQAAMARREAA